MLPPTACQSSEPDLGKRADSAARALSGARAARTFLFPTGTSSLGPGTGFHLEKRLLSGPAVLESPEPGCFFPSRFAQPNPEFPHGASGAPDCGVRRAYCDSRSIARGREEIQKNSPATSALL